MDQIGDVSTIVVVLPEYEIGVLDMAKSWSAQKWGKVRLDGVLCVLVKRSKEDRTWLAVDVDKNEVVIISADADVEIIGMVGDESKDILKKSYGPMIRAFQTIPIQQ